MYTSGVEGIQKEFNFKTQGEVSRESNNETHTIVVENDIDATINPRYHTDHVREDPKQSPAVALFGDDAIFRDPRYEVTWEAGDSENPRTWSVWYRGCRVYHSAKPRSTKIFKTQGEVSRESNNETHTIVVENDIDATINPRFRRVIYTTMYTSGVEGIQKEFNISSKLVVLLGHQDIRDTG
jgi:hypothetical protein